MPAFAWREFLERYSRDLLAAEDIAAGVDPIVRRSGWMGFEPATEAELRAAEARLGCQLPPSYRAFLSVSNGWRCTGYFIERLWSVGQIEWLRQRRPWLVDNWRQGSDGSTIADSDYCVYGEGQDPATMRDDYFARCLEVSDFFDGSILLLNPEVRFPMSGEWEAWSYASWYPGAYRYRSFQELMQEQHASFLALRDDEPPQGAA